MFSAFACAYVRITQDPRPFLTDFVPHWPPAMIGDFKEEDRVRSGTLYRTLSASDVEAIDALDMYSLRFAGRWQSLLIFPPRIRAPAATQWTSLVLMALDHRQPHVLSPVRIKWCVQAGNELVAVMDAAASLTAGNAAVSFDMDKLRVATPEMAVYLDHPWSAARMCAKAMSYVVMIVFGRIVFFTTK